MSDREQAIKENSVALIDGLKDAVGLPEEMQASVIAGAVEKHITAAYDAALERAAEIARNHRSSAGIYSWIPSEIAAAIELAAFHKSELRRGQTPKVHELCEKTPPWGNWEDACTFPKGHPGGCEGSGCETYIPASGAAAPPVDVRGLAKDICVAIHDETAKMASPYTTYIPPEQAEFERYQNRVADVLRRALGQEERA